MWRYIPVLVALIACGSAGAQTYRWVDERAVTNYGAKPPAGRSAQAIDTQSRNTIDTADTARCEADEKRSAVPVPSMPPPVPGVQVRGLPFDTYIRLKRGMSEGELLLRAGGPYTYLTTRGPTS